MIVVDAGYRTPAIVRQMLEYRIEPLFPYKRPMTKEGFFRKYEYVYDECFSHNPHHPLGTQADYSFHFLAFSYPP